MQPSNTANGDISTENISEWHQYSLEQTCSALLETSISDQITIDEVKQTSLNAWSQQLPIEPLEVLCKIQEPDELQLLAIIEYNSITLTNTYCPNLLPAPFASKMMTPSAFYEKHEPIYAMAKSFKCPVLFNEDADVLCLGSINPITVTIFSKAITAYISETFNIQPFISKVRLGYEGWSLLCEKHFSK